MPGTPTTPHPDVHALDELHVTLRACTGCGLATTRTQVVVGDGDPSARLMVVGEAPGAEEDRTGRPFVGRSGQLLERLLASELGLSRDECFIANVVKCRPPDNRNPTPAEVAACRPHLTRQVELVRPAVVLTLGNFASRLLLDTREGITRLRGRVYPGAPGAPVVVPTLHPAAVLRGGSARLADVRADLALVSAALEESAA